MSFVIAVETVVHPVVTVVLRGLAGLMRCCYQIWLHDGESQRLQLQL